MSGARPLVAGTRGSALALAQTALVCDALRARHPGLEIRVERITTTGDARPDVPMSALGRGMFVTEIENALREGRVDFAVHSAKDLPSTLADDLMIPAFLPREDSRDVLVSRRGTLRELPAGARVGTSSPRRAAQLLALRPDLVPVEIRGNVDTRLRKLAEGQIDAIVLAAAGLFRLGRLGEVTEWIDTEFMLPCPGQGALAVEARADDPATCALLAALDDPDTRCAVSAERAFLAELGAGCRAAVAAGGKVRGGRVRLDGMIAATDGRNVRGVRAGERADAVEVGRELARELLSLGGAAFLATGRGALAGKRVAITRTEEQADALVALLHAHGAEPLVCPTIRIEPLADPSELDGALARLHGTQWLVFTSANAVAAVHDRFTALGWRLPEGVRIAAVGRATAESAARLLRRPDFVPSRATAEFLARELPVRVGDTITFPKANIAGPTLARVLAGRGAMVREAVAYHTVPSAGAPALVRMVRERRVDAIVFTSPSTVTFAEGIGDALRGAGSEAPHVVCLGPSTARAAREAGIVITESPMQAVGALVETLERLFSSHATADA